MRHAGRIIEWRDAQGYGFIEPNGGGERLFVHARALGPGVGRGVGTPVTYARGQDERGRPRAEAVRSPRPARGLASARPEAPPGRWTLVLPPLMAALLGWLWWRGDLAPWVPAAYAAASAATFVAYWIDKRAARTGAQRTPEATLQLLALAGGWPGAVLAQQAFRHKTTKASFRAVFFVVIVLNLVALALLLRPPAGWAA